MKPLAILSAAVLVPLGNAGSGGEIVARRDLGLPQRSEDREGEFTQINDDGTISTGQHLYQAAGAGALRIQPA